MSAWSVLPTAPYIDRVIESVKTHPDIWAVWGAAWDAGRPWARAVAWSVVCDADRIVDRPVVWGAARIAILNASNAALNATRNEVLEAVWSSTAALIAWDDSAQFLELSSEKLEAWIKLSDDPRAILLLPAVRVFERIKELETL